MTSFVSRYQSTHQWKQLLKLRTRHLAVVTITLVAFMSAVQSKLIFQCIVMLVSLLHLTFVLIKNIFFIFISKSFNKTSSKLFFKRPSAAFHTVCMQMHKQILKTLIWMNAFTTNSDPKMTADLLMALIQLKCYVQRNWETGRTQMQHLWDIDQLEKVYALCLKS